MSFSRFGFKDSGFAKLCSYTESHKQIYTEKVFETELGRANTSKTYKQLYIMCLF